MKLSDYWHLIQDRFRAPRLAPPFRGDVFTFLTQARPIQVPTKGSSPLYIYIDGFNRVDTPFEQQVALRFHVRGDDKEGADKPGQGAEALGYGDPFEKSGAPRWIATPERVFWFSFTSRKSLEQNLDDLYGFVRERHRTESFSPVRSIRSPA